MRRMAAFLALASLVWSPFAHAENWAHWRGPTGNGTAPDAKPPVKWSSTENVKWKVAIPGRGISSPIIWEDRVFVTGSSPVSGDNPNALTKHEFKIYCFSRKDGKEIWSKVATVAQPHQKTHETNGFASASPCTDGKHVYAHFGSRGLFCYTLDGELEWKRENFGKMETLNGFGEGSSPTLEGNTILVPWDHNGPSMLYALDKLTGENIWKINRDEPTGWATPLVVEYAGKKQIVMNGQNFARSYDLETGKELWRCSGQTKRPVASPAAANGIIYIGSGFQGAFIGAFRPDGNGDIKGSDKVVWTLDHDAPDIASLLLSSGRLYFHKAKTGLLSCVDAATGKPHYFAQRIEGVETTYASPIAAGGYVFLTGRKGITTVIKDADQLTIVQSNDLGETISATPAPVDNELFLRGEEHLFCIANATSRE
jgi:outer membrane protein assembly factor BamB